jgi:hypothetical protein
VGSSLLPNGTVVAVVTLAHPPAPAPAEGGLPDAGAAPSSSSPAPETPLWTVTVDHGGDLRDAELDLGGVDALVGRLRGRLVAVSHRPRRFTTTVRLHDTDALAAANQAATLVRDAAAEVGLPPWPLVHVEVVRRD